MSKLLRHFVPGQTCFVTSVTFGRRPLLARHIRLLLTAIRRAKRKSDFGITAWVVLPDHFHLLLDAPDGDTSTVVQRIKLSFSNQYRLQTEAAGPVWQHRYWDHITRSRNDMNRHIDYIHFNPVKHGLAVSPCDYQLSSFGRFCRMGLYDWDWRTSDDDFRDEVFGE